MESQQPNRPSTAFEYFLYAAIVTETGLAAIIYKVIFGSGELAHMRYYFAIFYFAFLAWAIAQLNMLHRDRAARDRSQRSGPDPELEHAPLHVRTLVRRSGLPGCN